MNKSHTIICFQSDYKYIFHISYAYRSFTNYNYNY